MVPWSFDGFGGGGGLRCLLFPPVLSVVSPSDHATAGGPVNLILSCHYMQADDNPSPGKSN